MRAWSALLLALVAAGCFTPDLGEGLVACGTNQSCPPRYFCHHDGRCYRAAEDAGVAGGDLSSDVDMSDVFDFAAGDFASCMLMTCGPTMCGVVPNNCGGTIDCGNMCPMGESCGGGGTPHQCGCPTQMTCGNRNCGTTPDGCGGVLNCGGACPSGQSCGGGGGGTRMPNVCASGPACTPKTCAAGNCGLLSDGCSAVLNCGTCSGGKSCISGTCQ